MRSYLPITRRHQLITGFLQRQAEEEQVALKKHEQKLNGPSSHPEGSIPELMVSGPSSPPGETPTAHSLHLLLTFSSQEKR